MNPPAPRPGLLARLGRSSARHPVVTIAAWMVLLVVALGTAIGGVTGETLFDRLASSGPSVDGESRRADALLSGDGPAREGFTLLVHGVDPADPRAAEPALALAQEIGDDASLAAPFGVPPLPDGSPDPRIADLLAADGDGFLLAAVVEGSGDEAPDATAVARVREALEESRAEYREAFPGATVELGGSSLVVGSLIRVLRDDLARGEAVALPIALLVMLVVFGGLLAAGIPLVGAGAAIGGGLGILFGFTHVTDVDTTIINVVTAVGLGLSIDYGLLMVSRFREEYRRADGADTGSLEFRLGAIERTSGSAGRTVAYSGVTFLIASAGFLAFEPHLIRATGLGAISVTLIAIASALTLVPALLGLFGERLVRPGVLTRIPGVGRVLDRFGDVAPAEGFFSRLTRTVQRHPALWSIATALVLVALGTPLAGLRLSSTGVDSVPPASDQYTFLATLRDEFPAAATPRVALVTATEADADAWAAEVASLAHVVEVADPRPSGDGWRAVVHLDDPREGPGVVREIRAARDDVPGVGEAWVTGLDARTVDLTDSLVRDSGWAILVIVAGTVVLLFLMTGSLVIPLKALVASALSLGASIGVLVWGFQEGNFAGLMGFDPADVHGVDVLVLVLTFIFGFGLAMDYEMFILSRIKEHADAGAGAAEAIALGLQRSGRIITSAALIIIVVFAGFATGDFMVIKQLGVALAVAVLLDATIVRCLLVPALMTWQRRIMWWAPAPLKRLHARFGLSD